MTLSEIQVLHYSHIERIGEMCARRDEAGRAWYGGEPMLRIDHVVFGVRDLSRAATMLWERFGLEAQSGGSHAEAGTANMITPVGNDQFIELLTVSDPTSRHPIVPWLSRQLTQGDRLLQVAIEPPADIEATASRLGEPIFDVHRVSSDGRRVDFRLTGIAGAWGPDILPFFVVCSGGREWRCGYGPAHHRREPRGFLWAEPGSDPARVCGQLGEHSLPLRLLPGRPGLTAVAIDIDGEEAVLRL